MALPTLLLTRPEEGAQAFLATLNPAALARVQPLIAPLMQIVGTGVVPDLEEVEGVIFTSASGVSHAPIGEGRLAFCVGTQTTKCAIARGWSAHLSGSSAKELLVTLSETRPAGPLLHLGGAHTFGDIAETLSAVGIPTTHVTLYRQHLLPLEEAARTALTGLTILPVFSRRTAEQLVNEAKGSLTRSHIVALSDSVAEPFRGEKLSQCIILPAPQTIYMRKEVENLCLNLSLP